jgi:chromosome segregation ATPase
MKKLILGTLVSASLAAAAAAPALAQTARAEGAGPQARHAAQRQQEQRASRLPSERVEARLAYLKTALKITDAQQTQWDAFADTLRKQARAADERMNTLRAQTAEDRKGTPPTAIERMERAQTRLAASSTRLNETLASAKPLYAALSPEQQKVADELLAPRDHRGPGRHGGHRRA